MPTLAVDDDFRTSFVRDPASLRNRPALVLNADYRPLSYYPLSLWPWQEAVKAAFLDRVEIVATYDEWVHSPSTQIRIPSVVVLKDYVKPQRTVAFTRLNLFLRDEFCCQYCGAKGDLTFDHVLPRSRGGITSWLNLGVGPGILYVWVQGLIRAMSSLRGYCTAWGSVELLRQAMAQAERRRCSSSALGTGT